MSQAVTAGTRRQPLESWFPGRPGSASPTPPCGVRGRRGVTLPESRVLIGCSGAARPCVCGLSGLLCPVDRGQRGRWPACRCGGEFRAAGDPRPSPQSSGRRLATRIIGRMREEGQSQGPRTHCPLRSGHRQVSRGLPPPGVIVTRTAAAERRGTRGRPPRNRRRRGPPLSSAGARRAPGRRRMDVWVSSSR